MKKIYFLSLFFLLILNSKALSQEKKDALFFKSITDKIDTLYNLNKNKEIIDLCKKIIKNRVDQKELAYDYYRLGFYFKRNNQIDSAYYYYLKSNKTYLTLKDSLNIAKQLFRISIMESNQEFYYKSDSSAISVLKYLKKESNLYSSVYNCLGINARHQKEYDEALKWYGLAIKSSSDSIKKIRYINNQANVFRVFKNYDKAISYYKKIIKNTYYDSIPLKLKAKIIDNYAFAKFSANQKVDESTFLEAQHIKQAINDNYGLLANYAYLSDFHKKETPSKALHYAYKLYELSKELIVPEDRIVALDKIINLEKSHKIKGFAEERNRLSDSLQLAKQQSQNKFAKIIYNYEEEEKQKLKAQVALEKQKSIKTQILFTSIILLILFVAYFIYRHQKTKKEKVIQVYNTETRLAKKIHDEVANNVYLVMNKAQQLNHQNTSLLPDLEKIYALTRDISHENSKVLTGNNFENYLNQLFMQFSTGKCKVLTKGIKKSNLNDLAEEKQIVVYRVLQELLINMKKHSEATLVVISFSELKNKLSINYRDNGKGVNSIKSKNGIENMDTRIKSINGIFNFESEENNGFKASIQFKK